MKTAEQLTAIAKEECDLYQRHGLNYDEALSVLAATVHQVGRKLDNELGAMTLLIDKYCELIRDSTNESVSIVHECPPDGSAICPCCNCGAYSLPRHHRMTADKNLVTCGKSNG